MKTLLTISRFAIPLVLLVVCMLIKFDPFVITNEISISIRDIAFFVIGLWTGYWLYALYVMPRILDARPTKVVKEYCVLVMKEEEQNQEMEIPPKEDDEKNGEDEDFTK
jgi:hypothetical protein